MRPSAICVDILGPERLALLLGALSTPQVKKVLKGGGLKSKSSSGIVSQKRRRKLWSEKIQKAIEQGSDETAGEVLQQWLLHHQRSMLIDYLNHLGVKHQMGETETSFLLSTPAPMVREAAGKLFETYDRHHVAAYLSYIAHQQHSSVFDDWEPIRLVTANTSRDNGDASIEPSP